VTYKKVHELSAHQNKEGIALDLVIDKETIKKNLLLNELLVLIAYVLASLLLYHFINHNRFKDYSINRMMRLALKNNRFYPIYQPIFDHQNQRFCGVELLLRCEDREGNIIMPDSFIEQAESNGLIVPISLQVIETAFQDFSELLNTTADFYLSINLSMVHFKVPHFFEQLDTLRAYYAIQSKHLVFEVTERELLNINDALLTSKMKTLRDAGFSMAVDDFGTGHASISYLRHFPFNYLKIDKLFIHAIGTHAITESLNDAIIKMAQGLDLTIIAEGVETQEQIDYLVSNKVRYLQGWYFSKGVSIDAIKDLLKETNHEQSV
jgi:sensor c-di-GMP phosphodiesterase-like protein